MTFQTCFAQLHSPCVQGRGEALRSSCVRIRQVPQGELLSCGEDLTLLWSQWRWMSVQISTFPLDHFFRGEVSWAFLVLALVLNKTESCPFCSTSKSQGPSAGSPVLSTDALGLGQEGDGLPQHQLNGLSALSFPVIQVVRRVCHNQRAGTNCLCLMRAAKVLLTLKEC